LKAIWWNGCGGVVQGRQDGQGPATARFSITGIERAIRIRTGETDDAAI